MVLLVGVTWPIPFQRAYSQVSPTASAAQYLLGLATGIAVYTLLLRWGVWRWLAALATAPALLEPYAMANRPTPADTFFAFVVIVALLVLCWSARPSLVAAFSGGTLLGLATSVRPVGAPLVLLAMIFMLVAGETRRSRLAGALVVLVGFVIALAPYVAWYQQVHDEGARGQSRPADVLVTYQNHWHTPGALVLGGLLLGLLAGAGVGRAGPSGMRAACLLTAILPVGVLLGAVNTAELSWHNEGSAFVLWPAAGALGLTALLRGRRAPSAGLSQTDEVDRAAAAAFRERYGDPTLAPVVVVIAAYNEAIGLPHVLAGMPSAVCGLATDVVVVDDGSTDGTAAAANTFGGAYLVTCPVNRGQGAAMRLGYRIARGHGATYIITTDADAQYDTGDLPAVLAPVLDGSADFVTGSRRLGRQHTIDRVRRAGVFVFAWLVSTLTGEGLTDTSFGLRAMTAEVTATVTLNQPQYQSAELLIGASSHGYRIAEVPATMHVRASGSTKKGGNLTYGLRYGRVVLGTWWREGCPAPARERAPAMVARRSPASAPPRPGR